MFCRDKLEHGTTHSSPYSNLVFSLVLNVYRSGLTAFVRSLFNSGTKRQPVEASAQHVVQANWNAAILSGMLHARSLRGPENSGVPVGHS